MPPGLKAVTIRSMVYIAAESRPRRPYLHGNHSWTYWSPSCLHSGRPVPHITVLFVPPNSFVCVIRTAMCSPSFEPAIFLYRHVASCLFYFSILTSQEQKLKMINIRIRNYLPTIGNHACSFWWMWTKQKSCVRVIVSGDQLPLSTPLANRRDGM